MSSLLTPRHAVGVVTSLGLHGGLFLALTLSPLAAAPGRSLRPVEVEIAVPPPVLPPPVAPEPEPPPAAPVPALPALAPAAAVPPPVEPPPPSEPKVVDLSGVTLTDDGPGAGWSSLTGDGTALRGPLPAPRRSAVAAASSARPLEPASLRRAPPRPAPPALVALADLARRPTPPPLDALLVQNYPPEARRRGEPGRSVVVARIDADGLVRSVRVASESGGGFGAACRRTVLGSRWEPPRDRDGRQVVTEVTYTCRFEVER